MVPLCWWIGECVENWYLVTIYLCLAAYTNECFNMNLQYNKKYTWIFNDTMLVLSIHKVLYIASHTQSLTHALFFFYYFFLSNFLISFSPPFCFSVSVSVSVFLVCKLLSLINSKNNSYVILLKFSFFFFKKKNSDKNKPQNTSTFEGGNQAYTKQWQMYVSRSTSRQHQ